MRRAEEITEVHDAWIAGIHLVGDLEDGGNSTKGGEDLAVGEGLLHVADRLGGQQQPRQPSEGAAADAPEALRPRRSPSVGRWCRWPSPS